MSDEPTPTARLELRVERGAVTTIALAGDLDPATAPVLEAAIADAVADPQADHVVLDLSGLSFLDSSGLRVFVTAREDLAARGARLSLRGPSPNTLRLLDITGLSEVITVE